jgi:hypothetical protein
MREVVEEVFRAVRRRVPEQRQAELPFLVRGLDVDAHESFGRPAQGYPEMINRCPTRLPVELGIDHDLRIRPGPPGDVVVQVVGCGQR